MLGTRREFWFRRRIVEAQFFFSCHIGVTEDEDSHRHWFLKPLPQPESVPDSFCFYQYMPISEQERCEPMRVRIAHIPTPCLQRRAAWIWRISQGASFLICAPSGESSLGIIVFNFLDDKSSVAWSNISFHAAASVLASVANTSFRVAGYTPTPEPKITFGLNPEHALSTASTKPSQYSPESFTSLPVRGS